jgi:hypothetical protein
MTCTDIFIFLLCIWIGLMAGFVALVVGTFVETGFNRVNKRGGRLARLLRIGGTLK